MVFDYLDAGADDRPPSVATRTLTRSTSCTIASSRAWRLRWICRHGSWTVAWRFRSLAPPRAARCSTPTGRSASPAPPPLRRHVPLNDGDLLPAEVAAAVQPTQALPATSGKTRDSFATCSRRPASTATPSRSPSTSPGTATANATFETRFCSASVHPPTDIRPPMNRRGPSIFANRMRPRGVGRRRRDARARRAAAPRGAPEPDFPADRRAQVSFIRDTFDPSFDETRKWLTPGMEIGGRWR